MKYMKDALDIAKLAKNDVPVGAVIVQNDEIIAVACNDKENSNDITAHAEILAIKKAAKLKNNWRLDGCELYVTLEPCPMCAWAIIQSRISKVYFGSFDKKYGAFGSVLNFKEYGGKDFEVYGGILEDECNTLLNDFFETIR